MAQTMATPRNRIALWFIVRRQRRNAAIAATLPTQINITAATHSLPPQVAAEAQKLADFMLSEGTDPRAVRDYVTLFLALFLKPTNKVNNP